MSYVNPEFVVRFTELNSILAGFSLAIAVAILTLEKNQIEKERIIHWTSSFFLFSTALLLLAHFSGTLLLSKYFPQGNIVDPISSPNLFFVTDSIFYLTLLGYISFIFGLALSGYIRSRKLGKFSCVVSVSSLVFGIILFILITLG